MIRGSGADDVVVLTDIWCLVAPRCTRGHDMTFHAFAWRHGQLYQKAGLASFGDLSNDCGIILCTLASSIGAPHQFGLVMGLGISRNWVVLTTVYPLGLLVYELCGVARAITCGLAAKAWLPWGKILQASSWKNRTARGSLDTR